MSGNILQKCNTVKLGFNVIQGIREIRSLETSVVLTNEGIKSEGRKSAVKFFAVHSKKWSENRVTATFDFIVTVIVFLI
jgi:hypothetical protein